MFYATSTATTTILSLIIRFNNTFLMDYNNINTNKAAFFISVYKQWVIFYF